MAPEIALDAVPDADEAGRLSVLDPMCGSGTVLSAAMSRGHDAVGIDIDPLAVLMSSVATTPLDVELLISIASGVVESADSSNGVAPWIDDETERFVDFWFAREQKLDLIALSSAIAVVKDDAVRAALQVALSRIIVTKSPQASLAADTSHSRPHRVATTSSYDVVKGFERSVRSLCGLLKARAMRGSAAVHRGDSRVLRPVGDRTIDLAVTSPPYLNALDYIRGHKLALVWFGYSIAELRKLRSSSIGAERAPEKASDKSVREMINIIQQAAAEPSSLPLGTLERFAGDMIGFAEALSRVMKADARLVLVVGNSTLRGNYIRNDLIAQTALEDHGFLVEDRTEREIPATSRYLAINTRAGETALAKRMRSEIVLTLRST